MNWEEPKSPNEVTIKQLTELCEKYKEKKAEKKCLEDQVKEINKDLSSIQTKILAYLDEYGMKSFNGDFGSVSRRKNYSVKQPASPEAREAFFGYLKDQGVFDQMISVNSRTLASYVKQEIEAAKEAGKLDFVPPGIDKPEIVETISMRK
jgi:hypothetical protein